MDRYDDMDLECDGGGVSQKAALFGGMVKRSTKSASPRVQSQDSLSASSELSKSNDSLTDNNAKDKGGVFKGMFKKTTKPAKEGLPEASISSQNPELSASSDSLTDNKSSKEKSGVFGGILKRHARRPSQDLLDPSAGHDSLPESTNTKASMSSQNPKLSASSDSLTDNKPSKEKSGVFGGILKLPPRPGFARRPSQDLLEPLASNDTLSENTSTKESGGMFSGMFKKSPKRTQSQDDLSANSELSGSSDNLSVNSNTKESGGMFSGMFKKSPKPSGARTQSQEDLTAPSELSGSSDNLSENHTKEKGGIFSGMFKKKVARSQSQDDLSLDGELSASSENLTDKSSKGGVAAKLLKNPFTSSSQDKEKTEYSGDTNEDSSAAEKPKSKQNGFSAMMKSTFYADKQEKNSSTDDEETSENGDSHHHKQNKLAGAMTKLNPFRAANKHEKQTGSDDEDVSGNKQNKEKTDHSGDSNEDSSTAEKPKAKQNAMAEAMAKLNPFRHAHKKDTEDTETLKENEKQVEEELKPVKSNMIQQERKERSQMPLVPPRSTKEEMKGTSTNDKVKPRQTEDNKQDNNDVTPRERKGKPAESHVLPVRPSEEDMKRAPRHDRQKQKSNHQHSHAEWSMHGDEGFKEDQSAVAKDGDEMNPAENKAAKEKKHKQPNPFMPRTAVKAASDDEGLKEDDESSSKEGEDKAAEAKFKKPKRHNPFMSRVKAASDDEGLEEDEESSSKEEKKEEDVKDKAKQTKVKKPKKHNPFMPRVKAKVVQKRGEEEAQENDRSLFDRLEEFRDPAQPGQSQDVEDLMDWWNTVEPWEDTPENEDMTEKEEAKAFALTAEKVQKGIRVFNKLFSERAESLWQHVIDLNSIADGLDKFNKKTKIAQITGGSTSAIGGVATIAGLALAPVTLGTSLIVTAVGLGVAAAGGLTSASAGISNQVNNSMDRKKVEKIVEDYQEKMLDLNKCLKFIKQGIENLRKFNLMKMKNHAYNRDFPVLSSSFYEDGAMAGKAILINANEIMRVVQIANVAGSTAARAVQIASMATGVLTGLFVGMDIYFVAKDSKELKKGAKSEFAAKIREVATQLHDGLVELNTIREELQSTTSENNPENESETLDSDKKEKKDEYKYDSSDEDEIDRIKKAIKKDYENREYV